MYVGGHRRECAGEKRCPHSRAMQDQTNRGPLVSLRRRALALSPHCLTMGPWIGSAHHPDPHRDSMDPDSTSNRHLRTVRLWLLAVAALIFVMVLVGAVE